MSDRINIVGLEIYSAVGVPSLERSRRQKLLVNVSMKVRSLDEAAAADNVALTVDYALVCQQIKDVAAKHPRKLIETLAEEIASAVLVNERVKEVAVEIEKFILPDTRLVSVRIERKAPKRKKREKEEKLAQIRTTAAPHSQRLVTLRTKSKAKPSSAATETTHLP